MWYILEGLESVCWIVKVKSKNFFLKRNWFEGNFVVKNEIKGLFVKYKMFDVKLVEL